MQALRSSVTSFLPGNLSSVSLKSLSVESFPIVAPIAVTTTLTIIVSEVAQRLFSALNFGKTSQAAASLLAGATMIAALSPTLPIGLSSGLLFVAYKIYSMRQQSALEAFQTKADKAARVPQLEQDAKAQGTRITELEKLVEARDKTITKLQGKLKTEKEKVKEDVAVMTNMSTELTQKSSKIKELEAQIEALSVKAPQQAQAIEGLKKQYEAELQALRTEKDSRSKRINELELIITTKVTEIASLRADITQSTMKHQQIATQLLDSEQARLKTAKQLEEATRLSEEAREQFRLNKKEAIAALKKDHEGAIVKLEIECNQAIQDKNQNIEDLRKEISELQASKSKLMESNRQLMIAVQQSQDSLKKAQAENEVLNQAKAESEALKKSEEALMSPNQVAAVSASPSKLKLS